MESQDLCNESTVLHQEVDSTANAIAMESWATWSPENDRQLISSERGRWQTLVDSEQLRKKDTSRWKEVSSMRSKMH